MLTTWPKAIRAVAAWRPGPAASRRSSIALSLVLILICLVAVAASRAVGSETAKADSSVSASDLYQEALFDASRQDGQLNEYLSLGNKDVRAAYIATAHQLTTLLDTIQAKYDGLAIRDLVNQQQLYTSIAGNVITSLDTGDKDAALGELLRSTQTILANIITDLRTLEEAQHQSSAAQLKAARAHAVTLKVGTPIVLGLVLLLLFGLLLVTRGYRRNVEDQALHDALTGLPNRLLFANRATQAVIGGRPRGGPTGRDDDRPRSVQGDQRHPGPPPR